MDYEENLKIRVDEWLQENLINEGFFKLMGFEQQQKLIENKRFELEAFLRQKDTFVASVERQIAERLEEIEIEILEHKRAKMDCFGHVVNNMYQNGCCPRCSSESSGVILGRDSYDGGAPWRSYDNS